MCNKVFVKKSGRLRGNVEKYRTAGGRPQTTISRMRIACWVTKVTNTHSQYAVLIAFSTVTTLR